MNCVDPGEPGSTYRLLRLAAEVCLDLFGGFLCLARGVSSAGAGVEHLGQSLWNHELSGDGRCELALPLRYAPPLEVPRAADDGVENLDWINRGQDFLLVHTGAELDPAICILLWIIRRAGTSGHLSLRGDCQPVHVALAHHVGDQLLGLG